jgi:hypothetical protein
MSYDGGGSFGSSHEYLYKANIPLLGLAGHHILNTWDLSHHVLHRQPQQRLLI